MKPRIEGWVAIIRERSQGELLRRRSVHVLRRANAPKDEDLRLSRLRTSLTSLCESVVSNAVSEIVIDDRLKVWRKVEARSAHQARGGLKLKSAFGVLFVLLLAVVLGPGFPHAISGSPSDAENSLGAVSGKSSVQPVSTPTKLPAQSSAVEACQQTPPTSGTLSEDQLDYFFGGLVVEFSAAAEGVSGLRFLASEQCWQSFDK